MLKRKLGRKNPKFVDIEPLFYATEKPEWISGNEEGANPPLTKNEPALILWGLVSLTYYNEYNAAPGLQLLYNALNLTDNGRPERFFYPEPKLKRFLLQHGIPLPSLESKLTADSFDFLGFSLFHIPQCLNILPMLELLRIPADKETRRKLDFPLLVAGGPISMNPEPIADFFDIICVGEGEDWLKWMTELYRHGLDHDWSREAFLWEAAGFRGTYVPELTKVTYSGSGRILRRTDHPDQRKIEKVIVDLEKQPVEEFAPVILSKTERENFVKTIEIARGCPWHCRFCMVTSFYSPYRERPPEKVKEAVEWRIDHGLYRIGLSAPTPTAYSQISDVGNYLLKRGVRFTIQSERADTFTPDSATANRMSGRRWITIAVEAPSDRVRKVISKNLSEAVFLKACETGFKAGLTRLKIMAMICHPTETPEELQRDWEILMTKIFRLRSDLGSKTNLLFSICPFRPKPWTPFQWEPLVTDSRLFDAANLGMELARRSPEGALGVRVQFAAGRQSRWWDVFLSRGDRRVSEVLKFCHRRGWIAEFPFKAPPPESVPTVTAFCKVRGIPVDKYIQGYQVGEDLPWAFLDLGPTDLWMRRELIRSREEKDAITCYQCNPKANVCGACAKYPELTHASSYKMGQFKLRTKKFTPKYEQDRRIPVYLRIDVYRSSELTNPQEYRRRIVRALIAMGIEVNPRIVNISSSLFGDGLNWEGYAMYEPKIFLTQEQMTGEFPMKQLGREFEKRNLGEVISVSKNPEPKFGLIESATVKIQLSDLTEKRAKQFFSEKRIVKRGGGLSLKKGWEPEHKPAEGIVDLRDWILDWKIDGSWLELELKVGGAVNEVVSLWEDINLYQAKKNKPVCLELT